MAASARPARPASDSAVARSSPSAINASPARSASTGGSVAIVSQMRLQPLENARRAMPMAAASSSASGRSSKNPASSNAAANSAVASRASTSTGTPRMISRPSAPSTSDSTVSAAIRHRGLGMAISPSWLGRMCDIEIRSSILINVINVCLDRRDEVLHCSASSRRRSTPMSAGGLIAAHPDPADPRRSLYSRAMPSGCGTRRMRGRRAAEIAESAISWGEGDAADVDLDGCRRTAVLSRARCGDGWRRRLAGGGRARCCGMCGRAADAGRCCCRSGPMPAVEAALTMCDAAEPSRKPTEGRAKASLVAESALLLRSIAAALGADVGRGRRSPTASPAPGAAMPRPVRRSAPRWC